MPPRAPARLAESLFRSTFGAGPAVIASAPGRVNLLGEHTDYNGGPVFPVALERRTAVAAGPFDGWELVSSAEPDVVSADIDAPMQDRWSDYVVGVVRELRALGAAPAGARIAIDSSVPIGAGLSSSAALTVSSARALSLLAGHRLTLEQLVDVAFRAEYDQVGVRVGRMDQTISAHGRAGTALLFETAAGTLERVPMPGRIWIVETGVSHKLTGGELNERRRECEEALALLRGRWPTLRFLAEVPPADLAVAEELLPAEALRRRMRHVVTETARTRAAAAALAGGDLPELGRLLFAGHRSLRVDYESSCAEADAIVEAARSRGAHGARLTGAGWGGAVLVLAPEAHEREIVGLIAGDFAAQFGRRPVTWSTRAAGGVRREPIRG
jgi:galactokinase